MLIKTYIPKNQSLTADEIEEIETAAKYPITFDEDCPELSDAQIEKYFRDKMENHVVKKESIFA
ncbi:MAG: hypothetical protein IKN43_07885 [Selenomonadaceae bacterium]|nr:hypothetical protein [Selenomonadaceae bacterium]